MPKALSELSILDRKTYGSKASTIGHIINFDKSINTPSGCAFSHKEIQSLFNYESISIHINDEISKIDFTNTSSVKIASINICNLIKENFNERETTFQFLKAIDEEVFSPDYTGLMALRSSSPDEDGKESSFAGVYDSYIGSRSDIFDFVVSSVCRFYYPSAIIYRKKNGFSHAYNLSMVLQNFIHGEGFVSGICLTKDPVNDCDETIYIASNEGLCQSVCDGVTMTDEHFVDKTDLSLSNIEISLKKLKTIIKNGRTESVSIRNNSQILDNSLAVKLAEFGKKMEILFGHHVDIEWTISGKGLLYILQVRPICDN